jgi:hypothetical protein
VRTGRRVPYTGRGINPGIPLDFTHKRVLSHVHAPPLPQCMPDNEPDCVMDLPTPVGKGTALINHVDTINNSAVGPGKHRVEYFINMVL